MWWPWDLAGTAPLPNLGIASGGWTSNQEVWDHLASLNKPLLIFNDLEWVLRFALPFLSNILSETGSLEYHHLLLAPSPPPLPEPLEFFTLKEKKQLKLETRQRLSTKTKLHAIHHQEI